MLDLPLQLAFINNSSVYDFFLTDKAVKNGIPVSEVCFPKEGWIQVVPPKEKDGMLFEGWIAIKTDWYVEDNKYDNEDGLSYLIK